MQPISLSAQSGLSMVSGLVLGALASLASASPVAPASAEPVTVSVTPSFVPNVFGNTHTSTTGPNGQATPVPIVGGPECWFCPDRKEVNGTQGGWALLGIDAPGIYQPASFELLEPIPVITVALNGDPTYAPSETTDEPATKVKRNGVPTTTRYVRDPRFIKLQENAKRITGWNDGDGHAMKLKLTTKVAGITIPDHYLLVAGHIQFVYDEPDERFAEDCSLIAVDQKVTIKWNAYCYDITAPRGQYITFLERVNSAKTWYLEPDSVYEYLGTIGKEVTDAEIKQKGRALAEQMNKKSYNIITNNCRVFVMGLYNQIKS
ncbi:uncharacterized protein N7459_001081 [Penicillium hispanicum]|uniref:uncharacterized protein n=1 Tax=Penicillium hispanicum TaxID=1080232 RepID=UPI00253F934E|nr:uncharacterized protein N7459_001081 [Penicillium hispanicum]KAJ5594873.1 hypothetical protein N7459_001081 [Penicillium hispanicum]